MATQVQCVVSNMMWTWSNFNIIHSWMIIIFMTALVHSWPNGVHWESSTCCLMYTQTCPSHHCCDQHPSWESSAGGVWGHALPFILLNDMTQWTVQSKGWWRHVYTGAVGSVEFTVKRRSALDSTFPIWNQLILWNLKSHWKPEPTTRPSLCVYACS